MPSLVPEYEYDIFISYRRKDNKGEHWVTDFVTALKAELESTFKEEISVFFDENPHDGLLETHDVSKSLEGKLRCLVFIPIVSQTYCDTNSFAWQHELCVFNKISKEDSFGRDIKVASGNVASRILPVKVHDLDAEDKMLLESELGGFLRSIDFIYKSAGVNRPLKPNDDRTENLNHTYYRDQINKVANAAKETINALRKPRHAVISRSVVTAETTLLKTTSWKRNALIGSFIFFIVFGGIFGFYWIDHLKYKKTISAIRYKSIAILPFENNTGVAYLNNVGQIATDLISTHLIQNRFWKVIPTQDVFSATDVNGGQTTNLEAKERMIKRSNVDYLIIGHYNLVNDSLLLVASVNDMVENKILYTTPIITCSATNPMKGVEEVRQFILGFLLFSKGDKDATRPPKYDAYNEYLKGIVLWQSSGFDPGNLAMLEPEFENHFARAIALDADFLPPYFQLVELYASVRRFEKCDSLLEILATKQHLFLEGDSLNFTKQKFLVAADWDGLERFLLTKTDKGNSNFRPYYELAVNALIRQNKPKQALAYVASCNLKEFDFVNKRSDQWLYLVKMCALRKLRRYKEVLQVNESLPFKTHPYHRWEALYRLNQRKKVLEELGDDSNIGLFRTAQQFDDTATMRYIYKNYCLQLKKSDPEMKNPFSAFFLAVMEFRMGKIDAAEKALKQTSTLRDQQRQQHMLGLLYAATGRKEKATEVIDYLLLHENEFDHGVTRYYVAKIEAELNDKAKSVDFLREAVAKGFEFRPSLFEFDGDLGNMLNYQPFIELVTPKE